MTDKNQVDNNLSTLEQNFNKLRVQAEELIQTGKAADNQLITIKKEEDHSFERIIEELRVYHAELEIQNTELQQANLDKEVVKKHYEKLFHQNPLPSLILDSKGVIHEVNNAAASVFKIIQPIKRQRSIYQFLLRQSALEINELLINGYDLSHKYFNLTLNQPVHGHFDCAITKLENSDFEDERFLLLMRDISIEQELELEKNIFNQVVNNNSDIIIVLDSRLQLLANNILAEQYFDLSTNHQARSPDMYGILPEEVINACEKVLITTTTKTQRQSVNYKRKKIDGINVTEEHYYCRVFSIPGHSESDYLVGVTITDETKRLRSEIQLDIASEMFKNSRQAIMITHSNGDILNVNHAFEEITGYTEEEVVGKDPKILSSGLQRKGFYKNLWRSLIDDGNWQGEIWNRRKNGETYPQWLNITRVYCGDDSYRYLALFDDISSIKASQKAIKELAYHDQLTGLGNRHSLQLELKERITKQTPYKFCLMFIDLDSFKTINDTQGHEIGDMLLQHVAKRLTNDKKEQEKIFRVGGDEFVIVLPLDEHNQAATKAHQVNRSLQGPYFINGHENDVSCSIGITLYPDDATTSKELLKNADIAMYNAKKVGRNCFQFFSQTMASTVARDLQIEQGLKKALNEQELEFFYQPLLSLKDKSIIAHELLLRWPNSPIDNINIEELIQIAEKSGILIKEISKLAIASALSYIEHNKTKQSEQANIRIAVNLSSHDFEDNKHFDSLFSLCQSKPIAAQQLDIEITERTVMKAPEKVASQLSQLRQLGVQILVDDFGTGYSSFIYLRSFPVDGIKIDRAFIANLITSDKDLAIVKTILLLCNSLGLLSIAEGVETEQQANMLEELGCNIGQGYFFAKPQRRELG